MIRELSKKAKLSIFIPILTYGHESWVMTKKNTIASASFQNEIFEKN